MTATGCAEKEERALYGGPSQLKLCGMRTTIAPSRASLRTKQVLWPESLASDSIQAQAAVPDLTTSGSSSSSSLPSNAQRFFQASGCVCCMPRMAF